MTKWKATTEERYYEMLEVLPPAAQDKHGVFLVGEPVDIRNGMPTFRAFDTEARHYMEAAEPMTFREFKAEFPTAEYFYIG